MTPSETPRKISAKNQAQRVRKIPVEVECMQWPDPITALNIDTFADAIDALTEWLDGNHVEFGWFDGYRTGPIWIQTLEGRMRCNATDWIIKGVEGEFYPIKDRILQATYEPVES